jgi:osmotically-inducible protein OsmY
MAATELAKSVDNVKGVSNQLTMSSDPKTNPQTLSAKTAAAVSSSTTTTEREEKRHDNMKHDADKSSTAAGAQMDYPDSWITTKVKSEFATTKGISATDISVTTESGKVWLSGTVKTAAEKQQAMNAAKAVKGVQSVDGSKLTVQQ